MNNSGKQQSYSDREVDDQQQTNDGLSPVSGGAGEVSPAAVSRDSSTRRNGNDIGLAARLTDLFVGNGDRDSDLLMQRDTQEGTVVQWLQALDMQVMGACRADERLKPLLKLNVSSAADDRLLSHLSQHFEPSEVGLLARCLCIPLVSIRVGKINKQGTCLIPIGARGNLVVSVLATCDLSISFIGDDGHTERISILKNTSDWSSVIIKGIPADTSGRSFSVCVPTSTNPFYFWCSEKSKLVGNELLQKMRRLLERKPSLAELTGISNSRLQSFFHENTTASQSPLLAVASKPSRVKACSLSPRPSSFKEGGPPRNLASLRNVVRDKLRRTRVDGARLEPEKPKLPSSSSSLSGNIPCLISAPPPIPYYCWCPPVVSTLQCMVTTPPHTTTESLSFTLPPLSLPSSPLLTSEIPLPPFVPLSMPTPLMCDPIVHIPLIDICSSGQGYLVTIPPLPLLQESDSEKSARDTLRLLLSGSSTDGIANNFAAMSLVSVSPGVMRRCIDEADLDDLLMETLVHTGVTSSSSSSSLCSSEDGLSEGSRE